MLNKALRHVQRNAIAYVALFFAVGGGGAGAAIAATAVSSNSVHACVSKKTGALYVAKRCTSSESALSFNQRGPVGPAGQPAAVAYGQVDPTGKVTAEKGMVITETATGMYTVQITAAACKTSTDQIPSITPVGFGALPGYAGSQPGAGNVVPAVTETESDGPRGFKVVAGYINSSGSFVGTAQGFNISDQCGKFS